jgi:signal transduction histidine kinase
MPLQKTLVQGLVSVAVLTACTVLLAVLVVDPPMEDLVWLALFLPISGGVSVSLGAVFLYAYRGRFLKGVRGKLLVAVVLAAGLVLINVGFTAFLMFLSSHDLALLTVLLFYSLGVAAYFALVVANAFDSSLSVILKGIEDLSGSAFETRVSVNSGDELDDIANAFNQMAGKLEDAYRRQEELEQARRQLIAAVSHDLRTPLATMRVMVESINEGVAGEPETIERYHRTLQTEVEYMARLIEDLFELSRLDSGLLRLDLEAASIGDLVSDTLQALLPQASQRRLTLRGEVDGDTQVVMDTPRMQRVLFNLVQNALRHTPPDGSVVIRALDSGPEIEISVADTGEGIQPEVLPRIFDRFHRGANRARSREAGSGLGLTIAKGIVELHGGRIWAQSEPGAGATFFLALPKAARAS